MKKLLITAAAALLASVACATAQSNLNLSPQYRPQPQTDSERLQNFRPPPPPPPSYPRIQGGDRGDPRLYTSPNTSFGGNVTPNSVEGNVRVPLPEGRRR
jgi:hypothetical protein